LFLLIFLRSRRKYEKKKRANKSFESCFFTTEVLQTSEAEKFWPVYNTYDDKQFELRHQNEILCKTMN
jgi:hypothetical protein